VVVSARDLVQVVDTGTTLTERDMLMISICKGKVQDRKLKAKQNAVSVQQRDDNWQLIKAQSNISSTTAHTTQIHRSC